MKKLSMAVHDSKLYVICAGGDGSLPVLLTELRTISCIDIDKFSFVIFPYGSGNDLALTLGYGKVPEDCPFLNSLC